MCGIAGIYNKTDCVVDRGEINEMLEAIHHRGPDNQGFYLDYDVALGHRLLKIQDLSKLAFQPILGENYVMVYNGEIYNYRELRLKLKQMNISIKSTGDTEVLLQCFETWGVDKTLELVDGCYAIALFEKKNRDLYLIRDRVGIKPLYYYIDKNRIIFCSEIKGILRNNEIIPRINIDTVLLSFVCKLWMPHEETMFKGIKMIEQGTYLKVNCEGNVSKTRYYEYKFDIKKDVFLEENIEQVKNLLIESVEKKLLAEVPVAAFLSGGIDSSLICKIANDISVRPLHVYTVWYGDCKDPDYMCSKELAEKEGLIYHNTIIKSEDYSLKELDKVIYCVEELLIDKVYLSDYYNYKRAKQDGFTVVLNGQGADECWLGYLDNWHIYDYIDVSDSEIVSKLISSYYMKNYLFEGKLKKEHVKHLKYCLEKYLYNNLMCYENEDMTSKMQILSLRTILHDLLMQEDKLAMAHSIESRVPYVDSNDMMKISLSIDGKTKVYDGREKYILRALGKQILPETIITRKKMPFQEPPKNYNSIIVQSFDECIQAIQESKIVRYLFDKYWIQNIQLMNEYEKWWILNLWRFEKIFETEVE